MRTGGMDCVCLSPRIKSFSYVGENRESILTRLLGVSASAVVRAAHSEELPEVGNYL